MRAASRLGRGWPRHLLRWLRTPAWLHGASASDAGHEASPVTFDAGVIASMVRAAGVPCSVLYHHDGTVTITAGRNTAERYPIVCRLDLTTPGWPREASIHPGQAPDDDHTPQDILTVGCVTSRDVADLILAYITALAARPPGTPWELLDYDRLEHLGFDGTARGFPRGRHDPSRRAPATPGPEPCAVRQAWLRYRLRRSGWFRR